MNECVYFRHEVHRTTIKDRQRENVQTDIISIPVTTLTKVTGYTGGGEGGSTRAYAYASRVFFDNRPIDEHILLGMCGIL